VGLSGGDRGQSGSRFGAGAFTGQIGGSSGDGEQIGVTGVLDIRVGCCFGTGECCRGISGEGEHSSWIGFTGASSASLSPPESSTGSNAMAGSGSNGSGVSGVCLRPGKYHSSNSAHSEMIVRTVVGL
jgi:hypothetical protein